MKYFLLLACAFTLSCIDLPEDNMMVKTVTDQGSQKIGDNIYLKQINVHRDGYGTDRVYLLVDSANHLISNSTSANYEVQAGKVSRTESVSLISR